MLALVFVLAACGGTSTNETTPTDETTPADDSKDTSDNAEAPATVTEPTTIVFWHGMNGEQEVA